MKSKMLKTMPMSIDYYNLPRKKKKLALRQLKNIINSTSEYNIESMRGMWSFGYNKRYGFYVQLETLIPIEDWGDFWVNI